MSRVALIRLQLFSILKAIASIRSRPRSRRTVRAQRRRRPSAHTGNPLVPTGPDMGLSLLHPPDRGDAGMVAPNRLLLSKALSHDLIKPWPRNSAARKFADREVFDGRSDGRIGNL